MNGRAKPFHDYNNYQDRSQRGEHFSGGRSNALQAAGRASEPEGRANRSLGASHREGKS